MFGVFDGYELQLIQDWIIDGADERPGSGLAARRHSVNRFRRRPAANNPSSGDAAGPGDSVAVGAGLSSVAKVIQGHLHQSTPLLAGDADGDFLRERLAGVDDIDTAMQRLRGFLSPANHPTPVGLLATRIFSDLMGNR